MAMPTAGDDDIAWFDELLPDAPGVTRRPMFGNVAGFIDGQMFLALLGDRVAVRLGADARDELLRIDGTAAFEPMPGRPMKEYVVLPEAWKDEAEAATEWVRRSMVYAAELPPKPKRGKRRPRTRSAPKPKSGRGRPSRTKRVAADDRPTSPPARSNGTTPRPANAETPSRAHRAARHRAAVRRTTTRSAGRARRSGG